MVHRSTNLMLFTKSSVSTSVPNTCGVYYLRGIADEESLYPVYYVGQGANIRQQLLSQLNRKHWPEAVYLHYRKCDSKREAQVFARREISRHRPKYNQKNDFLVQ